MKSLACLAVPLVKRLCGEVNSWWMPNFLTKPVINFEFKFDLLSEQDLRAYVAAEYLRHEEGCGRLSRDVESGFCFYPIAKVIYRKKSGSQRRSGNKRMGLLLQYSRYGKNVGGR